ncbi:MAG: hypothetical protein JNM06_08635 [Blastocatellia bacterium]|nr:hypothetical protein [Blastocatellia bacterium]MBN8724470.1 hypothetical protein [Acidobacteriota bacterium]
MSKIEVKSKTLPSRCEICHQKDFFDPINNYCQRCQSAFFSISKPKEDINELKNELKNLNSHIEKVRNEIKKHQRDKVEQVFVLDKLITNIGNKVIAKVDFLAAKFVNYWIVFDILLILILILLPTLLIGFIILKSIISASVAN